MEGFHCILHEIPLNTEILQIKVCITEGISHMVQNDTHTDLLMIHTNTHTQLVTWSPCPGIGKGINGVATAAAGSVDDAVAEFKTVPVV